ncbi:hypothetical protein HYPSUDRAFT_204929 [Hypholoma sublateritium FD-334 SS-4]|uniref:Uncharacterized protein n=1 Tax=Hypholoma sublateritium (strain FD-334 SS-4) TaxID=945553 RepID=A0A0D2NQF9_HYPSF|nr:hypothetical protein HYPSUDRAFT_204929 [Hypholoma sublateritium FD-334 SS-4]
MYQYLGVMDFPAYFAARAIPTGRCNPRRRIASPCSSRVRTGRCGAALRCTGSEAPTHHAQIVGSGTLSPRRRLAPLGRASSAYPIPQRASTSGPCSSSLLPERCFTTLSPHRISVAAAVEARSCDSSISPTRSSSAPRAVRRWVEALTPQPFALQDSKRALCDELASQHVAGRYFALRYLGAEQG